MDAYMKVRTLAEEIIYEFLGQRPYLHVGVHVDLRYMQC